MSYQAYADYKSVDFSWLEKAPPHWKVMQLKRAVDGCVNGIWGSEPDGGDSDTIVIRVADFERATLGVKDSEYTFRSISEKEKKNRRLAYGDLLIEKSGGGEKTLVGQVVLFQKEFEAVTSNFVAKMTPKAGFDSRYLNFVFARFYDARINYCSIKQNTGIQNLDSEAYLGEKFCFPPVEEQVKIANFLDRETAKIDTLIEKQQQLIKLLQEKRQAVISHAVTKGLNPNAKMKDSGVEWLGEVPEHWKQGKLGYYAKISNGATPARDNSDYWLDGNIGWLNSSKINDVVIKEAEQFITEKAVRETSVQRVDCGDILIAITGEGQTRGRVAICQTSATINQHLASISIRSNELNYEYLFYWLSSQYLRIRYESEGAGSTKGAITCSDITGYPVPLPPLGEQEKVVAYLNSIREKYQRLIESANKQVGLLKERRQALISAAVTGKIDIRTV